MITKARKEFVFKSSLENEDGFTSYPTRESCEAHRQAEDKDANDEVVEVSLVSIVFDCCGENYQHPEGWESFVENGIDGILEGAEEDIIIVGDKHVCEGCGQAAIIELYEKLEKKIEKITEPMLNNQEKVNAIENIIANGKKENKRDEAIAYKITTYYQKYIAEAITKEETV